MKNKWHDIIRKRLAESRKECLACLYPKDRAVWGRDSKQSRQRTVELLNKILRGIPKEAWANKSQDSCHYKVASNRWCLELFWQDYQRHANLIHRNNDHTAWVRENRLRKGTFIDYDIGGS